MKKYWMAIMVALALVAGCSQGCRRGAATGGERADDRNLTEHDETNQSYPLTPGVRVEVSGISGPVNIETADINTAEVHIRRDASNRADLEYHHVIVEQSPTGLRVHGEAYQAGLWQRLFGGPGRIRQEVRIKLPRATDLAASKINGPVTIGEIAGPLQLNGINGPVEAASSGGRSRISGINGPVTITLAQLAGDGAHVSGINGGVEFRLAGNVNAELNGKSINGKVTVDVPDARVERNDSMKTFHATIGSGGAPVSVTGINGDVRFVSVGGPNSASPAKDLKS